MSRADRIVFLDALRGVAIILMVVNHTSRWWIDRPMGWPRYWLIYGSVLVPAALFLFLVGFCLPMSFRERALPPPGKTLPRYLRRGLVIVLWGYVLNLVVFRDEPLWYGGVLQTIGLCVILTAPAMWLVQRTRGQVEVLALAVIGYVAFVQWVPMLSAWTKAHVVAGQILLFDFPFWPWASASLIGLVAGTAWLKARARGEAHERRYFAAIAVLGVVCLAWYAAWEWWLPTTPRFGFPRDFIVNHHWTPRGVTLSLIGGAIALLLSVLYWLGEARRFRMRWLVTLGQTALVLYFVHQIVVYTVVKQALGIQFTTWTGYWLANVALMLGLLAFARLWLVMTGRIRRWRASPTAVAGPTAPAATETPSTGGQAS